MAKSKSSSISNRRRAAAEAAAARRAKERRQVLIGVTVVIVVAFLGITMLGGTSGAKKTSAGDGTSTTRKSSSKTTADPFEIAAPDPGATIEGDVACPEPDGSSTRTTGFPSSGLPECLTDGATYKATVVTDKGTFVIELDAEAAPKTVNNFVTLARYHFFDGVPFHRIIPGFVVQGGDAVGDGTGKNLGVGDPGYEFDDELPAEGAYEIGSVAMANSGANTNGSQFFVVTGEQGASLPPKYSLFGKVTEGLDVVKEIEAIGTPGGEPSELVRMKTVTIEESGRKASTTTTK